MARDYKDAGRKSGKSRKPSASRKKGSKGLRAWQALALGLAIGLGVAGYVYFQLRSEARTQARVEDKAGAGQPAPAAKPAAPKKPPAPPSKEAGDDKSRYDFYTILPNLEVVIPEDEIKGGKGGGDKKVLKPIEQPGSYLLQAGSYRSVKDADRVKAELAFLGVESSIESVTINNKDTWHRVRIGPFSDTKTLNKVRNRLLDNGIDVVVLRVKS